MKTRIVKIYQHWCVEFPFSVTVYCASFADAWRIATVEFDDYLLATEKA